MPIREHVNSGYRAALATRAAPRLSGRAGYGPGSDWHFEGALTFATSVRAGVASRTKGNARAASVPIQTFLLAGDRCRNFNQIRL